MSLATLRLVRAATSAQLTQVKVARQAQAIQQAQATQRARAAPWLAKPAQAALRSRPIASASLVYGFNGTFIGIWREEGTQSISCSQPCDPVAWSARAQVLLVNTEDGYLLWTKPHGLRPLESLLTVPQGWRLIPTELSLDGWTVMGTATTDFVSYP